MLNWTMTYTVESVHMVLREQDIVSCIREPTIQTAQSHWDKIFAGYWTVRDFTVRPYQKGDENKALWAETR